DGVTMLPSGTRSSPLEGISCAVITRRMCKDYCNRYPPVIGTLRGRGLRRFRNREAAEVKHAAHFAVFENELLRVYGSLYEWAAEERPVWAVQRHAVHLRSLAVSESQRLAAQRRPAHRWRGCEFELQFQSEYGVTERFHVPVLRPRGHLHHH